MADGSNANLRLIPRPADVNLRLLPRPPFAESYYAEDIWQEIIAFLDGKSILRLGATCKTFDYVIMEDNIWKSAFMRDFEVPDPGQIAFPWKNLYAVASGGCRFSYLFQRRPIIEWQRIASFSFLSPTAALLVPDLLHEDLIELSDFMMGFPIADLQLIRCPVCDLTACDGTIQILDARHMELFRHTDFKDGSWHYTLLGTYVTRQNVGGACDAMVDLKYVKNDSSAELLRMVWGKQQPTRKHTLHSVAANITLEVNEAVDVNKFVIPLRSDDEGIIVRIFTAFFPNFVWI